MTHSSLRGTESLLNGVKPFFSGISRGVPGPCYVWVVIVYWRGGGRGSRQSGSG